MVPILITPSFVDRDMFMRYLGGGIGHLEQFPPANNDNEVTYEYEEDSEDEDTETGAIGGGGGGENGEEDDDEDEDESNEDEDGEGGEYSDPGESSDEDMGNVY